MSRVLVCLCLILFAGSASAADPKPACVCGDSCACKPGFCPSACPVTVLGFQFAVADCPGGKCPAGKRVAAVAGARVLAAPCSSAAPRRLGFFKRLRGR